MTDIDTDTPADPERLRRIAAALGIPATRRHIFLCADQTNPNGRVTFLPSALKGNGHQS
jgi:hypothetical protein